MTAPELARVRESLDAACDAIGRDPASLPLSLNTGWIVGDDRAELDDRLALLARWEGASDPGEFQESLPASWIVATSDQALETLAALAGSGVSRVMAQQLLHRDLDAVGLLGRLAAAVA